MNVFELSKEQEDRAMEIHGKTIVVDAHCDRIMALMPEEPRVGFQSSEAESRKSLGEHLDSLEAGGIGCQIFAVYIDPIYHPIALRRTRQMIDVFDSDLEKQKDRIVLCTTFTEITKAVEEGKLSAVLSIEGGESLMGDLRMLRTFYNLGVRAFGLTHFPRNRLADGSAEAGSNSGLSTFGASVVEVMNGLGMVVDVSHINEKGFWDVMDVSKSPVIASHSNCKALCDHHRNLTDEQIGALADKDGVMGITYVGPFLEERHEGTPVDFRSASSVSRVLDHIDHAVELVGADHVGLGSDYMGLRPSSISGLEDISKVPNITKGLVSRGYADNEIRDVLGGSILRIFKEVLTG